MHIGGFSEREEIQMETGPLLITDVQRGHPVIGVVEVVKGKANLLEIVRALDAAGRFPRCLNRWQQQCHQDANNGNDNEEFH